MRSALFVLLIALLLPATPALAAPPDNDDRANAERINPPQTVNGTVRDATVQNNEAFSSCESGDATVWYAFTAPARGAVVVQLDAGGELDASIDVFKRERSELTEEDCDNTDKKGLATLRLEDLDGEYLIRVSKHFDSDPGPFTLAVLVPSAPARPPGKPLPLKGVKDSVDTLSNPSDAFSTQMTAGTSYRLSLAANQCTSLSVYGPNTGSFGSSPKKQLRCGGYRLFTPERSGRYSLLVEAGRSRGTQKYRLNVKRALLDDTTPGIFIRNNARVRGRVNGRVDSVDLYRFDVTSRSSLTLRVSGGPVLTLLKPGGRRLDRGDFIDTNVAVGRYYVAVRGRGKYTLRRISKTITRSRVTFNGKRKAVITPGSSARLVLGVSPSVAGRSTILLEKFDPLEGWQFLRRIHPRVFSGRASVTFVPPSIGRYRATATFRGSKLASGSDAGQARLNVRPPVLQQ
jgi:hypothetical protein